MIVPFILLLSSLAGIVAAQTLPGLSDIILFVGPSAIASLFLLLRAFLWPSKLPQSPKADRAGNTPFWQRKKKHIIVDGSNVMHWKDGTAQIETVRDVVQHLKRQGFTPGVVFDANVGHILMDKYQHHPEMAALVGLPEDQVLVVNKGTQADDYILTVARGLGVPVVTNDLYRDWADAYPEVREAGRLIHGHYQDGKLVLDMP